MEADPKVLVAAAKQMLDSTDEELNYATASDPGRRKTAKARAKPKKRVTENSESSSGGSSSQAAKDTDPMLAQLRKSWLGSGMQKESRKEKTRSSSKRRGQRFSLLSKKKEDSEDEPDSKLDATTSLIEAAVKADWPCSLHRSPSLGRRRARSPEAVEKATRRIPVGVHHRQRPTRTAVLRISKEKRDTKGAVTGYHASGKKMFRHPLCYIKRYVRQVEKELAVHSN